MQHAQHTGRAGRLEDFEPGQSVEVERLPGEEVLPGADKAPTRQLVKYLSRKPSGIVPDGYSMKKSAIADFSIPPMTRRA